MNRLAAAQDVRVERAGQSPVGRDQDDGAVADLPLLQAAGMPAPRPIELQRGQVGDHALRVARRRAAGQHRCCARRIFDAATISIARVICEILRTLRMRRRISRGLATSHPPRAAGLA